VTTTFALTVAALPISAGTAQNLIISVSGVLQEPGVAYNISGNNIIFSEAPLTADTFFGVLLGTVGEVNTVTDGTITATKLATDSVTLDKLAPASVSLSSDTITGTLPLLNGGTGGTSIKTINSTSLLGSGDIAVSATPGINNVGYLNIPQGSKTAAYTLTLADAGTHIYKGGTTAFTVTIPTNASVAFPIGTTITFVNDNVTSAMTISIAASDTLRWAMLGTTGSRVLGGYGIATIIKVAATVWMISGTSLT